MNNCPKCGLKLDNTFKRCPRCNAIIEKIKKCGECKGCSFYRKNKCQL